jgi:Uma2 family endonuclease
MATKAGMTWEEFLAAGKEGQRWEYVDGEVVFMPPVFRPHGKTNVKKVIQVWLDPQRKTAEVISPARPAQHFRATQLLTLPELPDFRLDLNALFA